MQYKFARFSAFFLIICCIILSTFACKPFQPSAVAEQQSALEVRLAAMDQAFILKPEYYKFRADSAQHRIDSFLSMRPDTGSEKEHAAIIRLHGMRLLYDSLSTNLAPLDKQYLDIKAFCASNPNLSQAQSDSLLSFSKPILQQGQEILHLIASLEKDYLRQSRLIQAEIDNQRKTFAD